MDELKETLKKMSDLAIDVENQLMCNTALEEEFNKNYPFDFSWTEMCIKLLWMEEEV